MKRLLSLSLCAACAVAASAQTLNVYTGALCASYPAASLGEMCFVDAEHLTIGRNTYALSSIDSLVVDEARVQPAVVRVRYQGDEARVQIDGDLADSLTVSVSGARVSIVQHPEVQREYSYVLSGESASGSFFMDGEYKATLQLEGVQLTATAGAALDVANGKRIAVVLAAGTTNTFADAAGGSHKACFFINGHPEFSGSGTLRLTGRTKHAYASDEYTQLKKSFTGRIEVLSAVGDGMHVGQYFDMRAGTVSIKGVKGDGLDVAVTKDPLDELNGELLISGGTLSATVSGDDVKAVKCDNNATITGGTITAIASGLGVRGLHVGGDLTVQAAGAVLPEVNASAAGNVYKPGDPELESKTRAVRVKGDFIFNGGRVNAQSSGDKAKDIKIEGNYLPTPGSDSKYTGVLEAANV